ncbi:MAG TPA: protein-disulfide reductase DsbD domain-containing protein [Bryobacteraceae bacterium]|nr:protein-disulfide reductase DsbD domain-containing protein [Bryobacteraceae bacterium]
MRFRNCFRVLLFTAAAALLTRTTPAQMAPQMKIALQPTVKVKRGAPATITLKVSLPAGFHANSNKPTDPNLIPLSLKWTAGPLQSAAITYPKPQLEEYGFTGGKKISVVTGNFDVVTKFKVPAGAASGLAAETGTLRYQACNDRMCFPPKNVKVNVTVNVE